MLVDGITTNENIVAADKTSIGFLIFFTIKATPYKMFLLHVVNSTKKKTISPSFF
ncbi:hypothetical protein ACT7DE_01260 [Bacillus paranthracis]